MAILTELPSDHPVPNTSHASHASQADSGLLGNVKRLFTDGINSRAWADTMNMRRCSKISLQRIGSTLKSTPAWLWMMGGAALTAAYWKLAKKPAPHQPGDVSWEATDTPRFGIKFTPAPREARGLRQPAAITVGKLSRQDWKKFCDDIERAHGGAWDLESALERIYRRSGQERERMWARTVLHESAKVSTPLEDASSKTLDYRLIFEHFKGHCDTNKSPPSQLPPLPKIFSPTGEAGELVQINNLQEVSGWIDKFYEHKADCERKWRVIYG